MKKVIGISLLLLAMSTVGAFAQAQETPAQKKAREAAEKEAAQKQQEWCDTTYGMGKGGNQKARDLWFDECDK